MRLRKHERESKRQRGQFMTPPPLARRIVSALPIESATRILEPSCGDGSFISAIVDRVSTTSTGGRIGEVEIVGVEIDPVLVQKSRALVQDQDGWGDSVRVEVMHADFFREYLSRVAFGSIAGHDGFDLIIGNPPFGGTFDHTIEDALDARLGKRLGRKIKKETYAFFIVACIDLLRVGGRLTFICSDTLRTIPTMMGLRHLLMELGDVELRDLGGFSEETDYPMVVLDFVKKGRPGFVSRNAQTIDGGAIRSTPNRSWGITPELSRLFSGPLLGDRFIASSGMTTGKNALFVREVNGRRQLLEPYRFEFYDALVTLDYELERARLGRISTKRKRELQAAETEGETERRLRVTPRREPLTVQLPDPRYRPYNKANNQLLFAHPTHYIYWEDEGDAVLTYKRTGNWYLRGVGGQPYFGKEGITWPLVATRFNARYMPPGYILDSGAPCALVREGVERDEIFFVLGWLLTDLANRVLKTVINHTRNIQSKDFERMPYPWWIDADRRIAIIENVKAVVAEVAGGRVWTWSDVRASGLNEMFGAPSPRDVPQESVSPPKRQIDLLAVAE